MQFETVADIAAPPERVWAVLADLTSWSSWAATVTESTLLTGAPVGIGSRVKLRQPRLPANTWVVTCWEPGQRFTWETARGGLRTVADHVLEAAPGGSRVTLSVTTSGPLAPVADLFMGSMARRYVQTEAAGLTSASETT